MTGLRTTWIEVWQLPPALLGFLGLILLGPALFWVVLSSLSGVPAVLVALSFLGGIPLWLSWCLIRKSQWFYPLFLIECAGLGLAFLFLGRPAAVHGFLVGVMAYMAFMVGSRQLLYPMMTRNTRLWRRAVRYRIGKKVRVEQDGQEFEGFLEDCSDTGVAISFSGSSSVSVSAGTRLVMEVQTEGAEHRLPLSVVWSATLSNGDKKVGLESLERKTSREYLQQETEKWAANLTPIQSGDDRLETRVRKTAMALWLICAATVTLL